MDNILVNVEKMLNLVIYLSTPPTAKNRPNFVSRETLSAHFYNMFALGGAAEEVKFFRLFENDCRVDLAMD